MVIQLFPLVNIYSFGDQSNSTAVGYLPIQDGPGLIPGIPYDTPSQKQFLMHSQEYLLGITRCAPKTKSRKAKQNKAK